VHPDRVAVPCDPVNKHDFALIIVKLSMEVYTNLSNNHCENIIVIFIVYEERDDK
jgi:hypothetical protein